MTQRRKFLAASLGFLGLAKAPAKAAEEGNPAGGPDILFTHRDTVVDFNPGTGLGVHLGTAEGRITSLRKVDWSSMRVNFFVMFPTAQMADLPLTYIAAFRAPAHGSFDNALAREFPNITSIDVSASIAQVQRVLDQVIRAVEFLFGFTLTWNEQEAPDDKLAPLRLMVVPPATALVV